MTMSILDRAMAGGARLRIREHELGWHVSLSWPVPGGEPVTYNLIHTEQDEALRHLAIEALVHGRHLFRRPS